MSCNTVCYLYEVTGMIWQCIYHW